MEDREDLSSAQERKLLWWRDRLRNDPMAGDAISKSAIPESLRREYGATNLFRFEPPGGWRGPYTVASRPGREAEVHILRILSHQDHDALMACRKR